MTRNAAVEHLQTHQQPLRPLALDLQDGVATDEILAGAERPFKPGLNRVGGGVHVVAVEPHPSLQPKRIAGAQAGGPDPIGLALLQQSPPQANSVGAGAEQLEAVLTGVTGPRDDAGYV